MSSKRNLARTAKSVVRGLNRGYLSKLPPGINSFPGGYQDGWRGNFYKFRPDTMLSVEDRLPAHYMKFHREWVRGPKAYIHDRPKPGTFERDEIGRIVPVQDPRIPILYPDEFHRGLWGGQGVVKGMLEPKPVKHQPNYEVAKETYWFPDLYEGVLYSEVLNVHLRVTMTNRAQRLIDEAYGLDHYLLKTPVNEVYSHLGLKIKREILLKLAANDASERSAKVRAKYQDFTVPQDVADWHGLPFVEAEEKLKAIDHLQDTEDEGPLKHEYRQELLSLLRDGYFDQVDPAALYQDEEKVGMAKALSNSFRKLVKGKQR